MDIDRRPLAIPMRREVADGDQLEAAVEPSLVSLSVFLTSERYASALAAELLRLGITPRLTRTCNDSGCRERVFLFKMISGDAPTASEGARPANSANEPWTEPDSTMTARERSVLQLIGKGLSNKKIARDLSIAPETVKSHAKHIFHKLGTNTRAQAVARGAKLGIL